MKDRELTKPGLLASGWKKDSLGNRVLGLGDQALRPSEQKSQKSDRLFIPPGRRQDMPTIAMDILKINGLPTMCT